MKLKFLSSPLTISFLGTVLLGASFWLASLNIAKADSSTSFLQTAQAASTAASTTNGTINSGTGATKNSTQQTEQSYSFWNPLSVNSFTDLAYKFLSSLQGTVGWLAVIFIMLGGIMYILSGSVGNTTLAKSIIIWALIGFAIAVAAPTILKEIYGVVATGGSSSSTVIDNASSIKSIVTRVLTLLLGLVGILGIIGFLISGFLFLTSAGNSSQAETAKTAMRYTLLGIALSGAGLIIVNQLMLLIKASS